MVVVAGMTLVVGASRELRRKRSGEGLGPRFEPERKWYKLGEAGKAAAERGAAPLAHVRCGAVSPW